MNDEEDDEDIKVVARNVIASQTKRQHVSNDPREQDEAERKKLYKMFEPILEEKMAEQMKYNEVMLEKFKESMIEVMHEQSNQFLSQVKQVIPKNPPPQANLQMPATGAPTNTERFGMSSQPSLNRGASRMDSQSTSQGQALKN